MSAAGRIRDCATVQTWVRALAEQWGEEPSDLDARIAILQRFCGFVQRDPDALIEECTREVESGKRIRVKARREYTARIADFQATVGGEARAQARAANIVRSFFIHNGIFMQAGLAE